MSEARQPSRRMRTPEAKARRRSEILDQTRRIFAERAYAEIRVQDIVAATGLAKGTFYLYFPTKEALFLALLLEELESWFAYLQSTLQARPVWSPQALAGLLADSLCRQIQLRRLLGLLHNVLEASLELEAALVFKQTLSQLMAPMAIAFERALPGLGAGDGGRLLLQLHALVVGLEQMCITGPVLTTVLSRPELAHLRPDFATELEHLLVRLLAGWQQQSTSQETDHGKDSR